MINSHISNPILTEVIRIISIPLPTHRLALAARRTLEVDAELSPLVKRKLSLSHHGKPVNGSSGEEPNVLVVEYRSTTDRMLRVAVNGFMESMGVVLGVMEELDVDVIA